MHLIPKNIRNIFFAVLLIKFVCIDDRFSKPIVFKSDYCKKKMIIKHFNKSLVMPVEDERSFKSSNKCWICNKWFAEGDNKVRDHDHVTAKYRRSAHWNCNINIKSTKKVPVTFNKVI